MQVIWKNLVEGIKNFCHHNGFDEVVLGLSGGLDSAIVAVAAAEALGGKNVHAIMMKTKYTSDLSLEIAAEIAKLNELDYKIDNIQPLIDEDIRHLENLWQERPKNIVIENLQARERGKLLMAYTNQYNCLLLSCGNKSELAMGYCTLYGDTCGGLAPIANLYKSEIFELAKWRNAQNKVLPEKVIYRAPSAELAEGQKDEDSLPPYGVLDKILRLHIDSHQTKAQIVAEGFDAVMVENIIVRYERQAFKREQTPPALKL